MQQETGEHFSSKPPQAPARTETLSLQATRICHLLSVKKQFQELTAEAETYLLAFKYQLSLYDLLSKCSLDKQVWQQLIQCLNSVHLVNEERQAYSSNKDHMSDEPAGFLGPRL